MRFLPFLSYAALAYAFPNMHQFLERDLPLSDNEGNSGPTDSLVFDATEQFVEVRPGTAHEYQAPKSTDLRGPW